MRGQEQLPKADLKFVRDGIPLVARALATAKTVKDGNISTAP